jgi:hypothetical protein
MTEGTFGRAEVGEWAVAVIQGQWGSLLKTQRMQPSLSLQFWDLSPKYSPEIWV